MAARRYALGLMGRPAKQRLMDSQSGPDGSTRVLSSHLSVWNFQIGPQP